MEEGESMKAVPPLLEVSKQFPMRIVGAEMHAAFHRWCIPILLTIAYRSFGKLSHASSAFNNIISRPFAQTLSPQNVHRAG